MTSPIRDIILSKVQALPDGLRRHTLRVEEVALSLAQHHHVDEEKVRTGALAHDLARAMKGADLLLKAREYGIAVNSVEQQLPILLHGPVAAEMLRRTEGLDDSDVYDAIYWHSTAHKGLSHPAKVVFLADKLDPEKSTRYRYQDRLKTLADKSLDEAIYEFLNRELIGLLQRDDLVHPAVVEARNDLALSGFLGRTNIQ